MDLHAENAVGMQLKPEAVPIAMSTLFLHIADVHLSTVTSVHPFICLSVCLSVCLCVSSISHQRSNGQKAVMAHSKSFSTRVGPNR